MPVDERHAVLFEPVRIGPVTAKNRFYQVPHCCGMGHLRPQAHAAMRGVKAEGGWAVVSTEETEIHPSSDLAPATEQRLWDERDIPALALMTEAVHAHGALAAIELAHNGHHAPNLCSRIPALAPHHMSLDVVHPRQARAMDRADLRQLRRWHADAVRHAIRAGFDIVYAYAGHHMSLAHHFLSPVLNQRGDEYGGSLENRVRLTRELLEDAREAAEGRVAIAFRFAVDDCVGSGGMQATEEGRGIVELLAELPDLWDVNVAGWENDSVTSRFEPAEGAQEAYTAFVKSVTSKPVVGVGRYTSPDRMAGLVRRGVLDFIGAARPSIADPFLPRKVEEGRSDEIRECIGCNVCVSADNLSVPIRCTQNPTMGEEWRRGWHPERATPRTGDDPVLVVGAGPAGLEAALQLGRRGYPVALAEAARELGGRTLLEPRLRGLSIWGRVRDYREQALSRLAKVEVFRESRLTAGDVLELGHPHVIVATGSTWRRDGVGRATRHPIPGLDGVAVLTPDDIMRGAEPGPGPVVVYDDDRIYMGGAIADHLSAAGAGVTLVTPAPMVSPWAVHTLEQGRIEGRLQQQGVRIVPSHRVSGAFEGELELTSVHAATASRIACATLVLVTERLPETGLAEALGGHVGAAGSPLRSLALIGDALAPGLIADAVFDGHLAAESLGRGAAEVEAGHFAREMPALPGDIAVPHPHR